MKSVLVSVLIDARGYMFVSTLLALSIYLSTDIAYIVEKTEKYIDPFIIASVRGFVRDEAPLRL